MEVHGLGLSSIITVITLPVASRNAAAEIGYHCTSSVYMDYAVKGVVLFLFSYLFVKPAVAGSVIREHKGAVIPEDE